MLAPINNKNQQTITGKIVRTGESNYEHGGKGFKKGEGGEEETERGYYQG